MDNNFGEFLRRRRLEQKLTQKDLAKELFVSESAISKWEKNVSYPDITILPKLSKLLNITEHELITASIDEQSRKEKVQAKRWRVMSASWSLFFYISYAIAIVTCFICNLAINKTLSWFWIVLCSLILAFSFTNLPKLIKKLKLFLIPLSMFLALSLTLGVCCIYTNGNWFMVATFSVFLGLLSVFLPICVCKYRIFNKIKKYNDFFSIGIIFIALNLLLIIINHYTIVNGYASNWWYIGLALPIVAIVYLFLNFLLCIRFLKINRFFKTGIILAIINLFIYLPPLFIKVKTESLQNEIDSLNIFRANFSNWTIALENNVHCIIFLTITALAVTFLTIGIIRAFRKRKI